LIGNKKLHKMPTVREKITRRTALKYATAAIAASCFWDSALNASAESLAVGKMTLDKTLPPMPEDVVKLAAPLRVLPFDAAVVRLQPGPFYDAQMRNARWLLSLQPDRMLSKFLANAGLSPKGETYGGWENTNIAGHTAGHYLSACAAMYRATGIVEFRTRVNYMVSELAVCQQHSADGLITGMPHSKTTFAQIQATGQTPPWSEAWAPWYNVHKMFAGLRDAYLYCGNEQAKVVFLRLCDWALLETNGMSDEKIARMLSDEHGGMVEVAADAYGMTGDSRYLELVRRFTHHAIMDPMAKKQDILDGQHSNTNIPKFVGYERVHELTGKSEYHDAAEFFWTTVVRNRTYANGGNGDQEHFFPITEYSSHFSSDENTETCCTYNMLKLTDELFERDPKSEYADYAERATLNHILASQEPDYGMVCYFTPFKAGHFRIYGGPENAMWCCTGTGMENHARYGFSIFYHTPDHKTLYINQYVASSLDWKQAGIKLSINSELPGAGRARVRFTLSDPSQRTIKLRKPFWAEAMAVKVNGKSVGANAGADGYVSIERVWKSGDEVEIELPMSIRFESTPHTPNKCAIMYGPVLLASPMGTEGMDLNLCKKFNTPPAVLSPAGARLPDVLDGWTESAYGTAPALDVPTLVGEREALLRNVRLVDQGKSIFKTVAMGDPSDVTLVPFYALHHQRYNVYWSVYTASEWKAEKEKAAAEKKQQQALDARTTDVFLPGNQQSEIDHQLRVTSSGTGAFNNRSYRDANNGWFSYTMKVDPSTPLELMCTYWGSESGRTFDILIDDTKIATQQLNNNSPNQFFNVLYDIPANLISSRSSVVVTLKSAPDSRAGGLFESRIVRKIAETK